MCGRDVVEQLVDVVDGQRRHARRHGGAVQQQLLTERVGHVWNGRRLAGDTHGRRAGQPAERQLTGQRQHRVLVDLTRPEDRVDVGEVRQQLVETGRPAAFLRTRAA